MSADLELLNVKIAEIIIRLQTLRENSRRDRIDMERLESMLYSMQTMLLHHGT